MNVHHVFAFGTLTDPKTREKVLGREVPATIALLPRHVKIVAGVDWATILNQDESTVVGVVFDVDAKELKILDTWEGKYKRKKLRLHDGTEAWVYCLKRLR